MFSTRKSLEVRHGSACKSKSCGFGRWWLFWDAAGDLTYVFLYNEYVDLFHEWLDCWVVRTVVVVLAGGREILQWGERIILKSVPRQSEMLVTYPDASIVVEVSWRRWWLHSDVRLVFHAGRLQWHSLRIVVLAFEAELEQGHDKRHQEAPDQDIKYPSDIAQGQLVPGRVLLVVATLGAIVPPLVLQLCQFAVLLKCEHR